MKEWEGGSVPAPDTFGQGHALYPPVTEGERCPHATNLKLTSKTTTTAT